MKFKAAMFDFDGTITHLGVAAPIVEMLDVIIEVLEKCPLAVCSGRQFDSFNRHALKPIVKRAEERGQKLKLENFYLIGENGGMGYFFNKETGSFEEFYRGKWPERFVPREVLRKKIMGRVKDVGIVMDVHETVLVVRPDLPPNADIADIIERAEKLYDICIDSLRTTYENFEDVLHVGNSGIGVILCSADSDKDVGVKRFGDFLKKRRGLLFDEKYSEILVIGDRANVGGNDHYFLNGKWGTPYTVGVLNKGTKGPREVFDDKGEKLLHDEGTRFLLRQLL